jgi:hypothetical protein
MPAIPTLHSHLKAQADRQQDDPRAKYLFGFERDEVQFIRVKTCIRRLWLAFESSKKFSLPRCYFDIEAERFAKEIEAWASVLLKNEDRLAVEIAKDSIVLNEKTKEIRSVFLEDIARSMLVTREWGDRLWGHRRFCTSPLRTNNGSRAMTSLHNGRRIETRKSSCRLDLLKPRLIQL